MTTAPPAPGLAAIDLELDGLDALLAAAVDADSPAYRIGALDGIDAALFALRSRVADARALAIAEVATETSARRAAAELGLSLAAVSKAMARARDLGATVRPSGTPVT